MRSISSFLICLGKPSQGTSSLAAEIFTCELERSQCISDALRLPTDPQPTTHNISAAIMIHHQEQYFRSMNCSVIVQYVEKIVKSLILANNSTSNILGYLKIITY
jgi:hypothetical protein